MASTTKRTRTRDCRVCGGEGWFDGAASLRRNATSPTNDCPACEGTGREPDETKAK
jgi:DnaJ-class molecular chaperone